MTDQRRWPEAPVGHIARLRALAAGLPGVELQEILIDDAFERVWGFVADLETSVPLFESNVGELRVMHQEGEKLTVRVVSRRAARIRLSARMDVTLQEGWCWMVSRPQFYVVGMAAEPLGGLTRFGLLEGVAFGAPRPIAAAVAPLLAAGRWRHRRHIRSDLGGLVAALRRQT